MIYTVTCNPAVDYLVYLDELSVGAIQRSSGEAYYFSGKGINVSKVLKTLGHESVALGFLAGFTGAAIAADLERSGIRQDFCMLREGNTRINVKIRHGMETDLNCQGPTVPKEMLETLSKKLSALGDGDVLILSGSVPKGMEKTMYGEMLSMLRGKNTLTVVDADGALLLNAIRERPFLIKPNREELEALFGQAMETDESLLSGAALLRAQGARNVLISLGGDGALLSLEDGSAYRIGAAEGRCVNSIGAGDSMLAGFVSRYLESGDMADALRFGSAVGAATAFSEGLATACEIARIYRALKQPIRIV